MMEVFKKLGLQAFSVLLLLFGAIGIFSLISYDPNDPSWYFSTDAVISNWAGVLGTNLSSVYLAFIGMAGYFASVTLFTWGVMIMRLTLEGREDEPTWLEKPSTRFIFFILATVFLSSLLAVIDDASPVPDDWVTNSYGGHLGFFIKNQLVPIIGYEFFTVTFGILALSTILVALGISAEGWFNFVKAIYKAVRKVVTLTAKLIADIFISMKTISFKISDGSASGNRIDISDRFAKQKKSNLSIATPEKTSRKIIESNNDRSNKLEALQGSFDIDMRDSFHLPPLSLLSIPDDLRSNRPSESSLSSNAEMLEKVLEDFGVKGKIIEVQPGPVVTRYALEPAPGTKSSRVIGLADDIARSMTAPSARIAVIAGQNAIGIELPNSYRETVYLKEVLVSSEYKKSKAALPLSLGKDIAGKPIIIDLAKTPHLLVAGTTGSGKSVGLNGMILSLLYRYSPDECKFIMIDPKMLELSVYQDIPHLLSPVVTEPNKAIVALKWTVKEMENRYRLMSNLNVRNIDGYNQKIVEAKKKGIQLSKTVQTGYEPDTGRPIMEEVPLEMEKLPYIVVVVDEMADLMLVAGKEIEASIQRLAQMARAAGIHVILATQRPSVDVITGIIKANFPSRISYQVTSKIDSRTILGEQGAEQLLGMGDLLYMAGGSKITRVHGPFVKDEEVEQIANFLRQQGKPEYVEEVTTDESEELGVDGIPGASGGDDKDQLYDQAVAVVLRDKKVSTSYVQRALKIGYNRAANIIDQMEQAGLISEPDHVGRRKILAE
jgi:S-DNA-T family DNA segregation ATPase FtsK/SpoIIIE